jgi:hypothetical protein
MHHAAAPLESSRQRQLHGGRSLNQSDQSKMNGVKGGREELKEHKKNEA